MNDPPDAASLNNQLCFSVYSTSIAINRLYKPLLDKIGITYPQYLVLASLWEKDRQTIGAIADRLALDPSTIPPLVKRLEQAGFVSRQRCNIDERMVHVTLTKSGQAAQDQTSCLKDAMLSKSEMSMDQIIALNHDIQALLTALTRQDIA